MKTRIKNALTKFHNDEAGLEALQVVMILAVAAVALIAVKTQWNSIRTWFKDVMGQGTGASNWTS
jgi:Flp pilus assembly pilin Flp